MRYVLFVLLCGMTVLAGWAQPPTRRDKPTFYSASSDWQTVTLTGTPGPGSAQPVTASTTPPVRNMPPAGSTSPEPDRRPAPGRQSANAPVASVPVVPRPAPTVPRSTESGYRPAFTGDFATNRNGWKAGNIGDYNYQIGLGRYNIRKRNVNTSQVAFSYVMLPSAINLTIAETFTIRLDIVADSGRIPTGGLLFGVRDSLNYNAFTLSGNGDVTIVRVVNGEPVSDYMPADPFRPGVPLDRNRDRLIIRRRYDALHFYINEQEVRGSPYPFRPFSGNGIGMITSAYWTSFQKLGVTLGL